MNKKGVSAILATIIVIFITLALVVTIVGFSNNFFGLIKRSTTTLSPEYSKLKISIDDVTKNPLPPAATSITITITRIDNEGDQIPLRGIGVKLRDTHGNTYTYNANDPPINASMSKTYTIINTDICTSCSISDINKVSISGISPEGIQTGVLDERDI